MKRISKSEQGMVIVEASIVFPVMFLVIFLMIFTGNAYLQKCRVDSCVTQLALEGASYCADPMLENVTKGSIPNVDDVNVYPYRYFDPKGAKGVEDEMQAKAERTINNMDSGLFSGMTPRHQKVRAQYNNGFIYSTFSVDVEYKIIFPIRLLGQTENMSMSLSSHADMPVSDTSEFIRNVDMVEDYMEKFGISEKIDNAKNKLDEALSKAKEWFNK